MNFIFRLRPMTAGAGRDGHRGVLRRHAINAPEAVPEPGMESTLDQVDSGARVTVVSLACGRRAAQMLAQRGIRVGEVLSVGYRAPVGGPVWVELHGAMFAIGRGLARKILVNVLSQP